MSKLRDYQRVIVDNIANDIEECFSINRGKHFDETIDAIKIKLESRIEAYDRERKEQIERDLPAAIVRAMADVC